MSVWGCSRKKQTRHGTSAQLGTRNLLVNSVVRYNVWLAIGGFSAREARQWIIPNSDSNIRVNWATPPLVQCRQCEHWFRRPSDRARHKCAVERRKTVLEQCGVQCDVWGASTGFSAEKFWLSTNAGRYQLRVMDKTTYSCWVPPCRVVWAITDS